MISIIDQEEALSLYENKSKLCSLNVRSLDLDPKEDPGSHPQKIKEQTTLIELLEVNVGTKDEPRPRISSENMSLKENKFVENSLTYRSV